MARGNATGAPGAGHDPRATRGAQPDDPRYAQHYGQPVQTQPAYPQQQAAYPQGEPAAAQPYDGYSYPGETTPPTLAPGYAPARAAWPPAETGTAPHSQPRHAHPQQPPPYPREYEPPFQPGREQQVYDPGFRQADPAYGHGYEPEPRTAPPATTQPPQLQPRLQSGSQPGYAPQFDAYQPGVAGQPTYPASQFDTRVPHTAPAPQRPPVYDSQPGYYPSAPAAPRESPPDLRGGHYDHYAPNDPRGYDLGAYLPPQQPRDPATHGHGHGHEPTLSHAPVAEEQWGMPQQVRPELRTYDPNARDQQLPVAQQGAMQTYGDQHDDDGEYEDEPRSSGGRRTLMVVGALVGAIAIGGGLAYGYKTFMPSQQAGGSAKVVKAPQQPAKTQPADPGGKKIAGAESKLLDRLGGTTVSTASVTGGAAASASASVDTEPGAPKRVQVMKINPDGSVAPPVAQPVQTTSVPGLVLVDGGVGVPGAALPAPRTATPPPVAAAQPAAVPAQPAPPASQPIRPKVVSAVEPEPEAPIVKTAPPAAKRVAAVTPAVRDDAAAPTSAPPERRRPQPRDAAATAATTPAGKSAGWVAVLATVRTQADALRTFADMQQRYGSVLSDKIPDVREVDLSKRNPPLGVQNRLMVGPPGSREAANTLCTQLKAAGHKDCWITAY